MDATPAQRRLKAPLAMMLCLLALSSVSCSQMPKLEKLNPWYKDPDADPVVFPVDKDGSETETKTVPTQDPVVRRVSAREKFDELLAAASRRVDVAKDVHCTLVRREVVGNALQPEETLDFTQRFDPHALRLEWIGARYKGRKMSYVKGQNDDKVLVRLGTVLGRLKVLPFAVDGAVIRSYSRHTPDVVGYNRLLDRINRDVAAASTAGKLSVTAGDPETTDGRRTRRFELTLDAAAAGTDCSKMIIRFDLDTALPVHTITHDATGRMVEDYRWRNVELDKGLTDDDFKI